MSPDYTPTEFTADVVEIRNQPDGPGLRYGKHGEATALARLLPGGAELIRSRIGQFQAESRYWEGRIGTVHQLRIIIINNDDQALITVTYDGDFIPYLGDIVHEAGPWFDALMKGAWAGYDSAGNPETQQMIVDSLVTAEMFYVHHHDLTVRDITRLKRLGGAVTELLDAAG